MTDNELVRMLKSQVAFQEKLGHDLFAMSMHDRVEYVKANVLALTDELHEALGETTWKPWAENEPDINAKAYFGELVDAWHFLMNLMLVVTDGDPVLTSDMLASVYEEKHQRNIARQDAGYDGVSTKCPSCKRELDKSHSIIDTSRGWSCFVCGEPIPESVLDAVRDVLSSS